MLLHLLLFQVVKLLAPHYYNQVVGTPLFLLSKFTFLEGAMDCYQKHNKPKDGCSDWQDKSKLLIPNTIKERKAEGMARYQDEAGPKTYLCNFCPVSIAVNQRKQKLIEGIR